MFAKTLIKLIDYAVFPAVLIVSAKIVGVFFLVRYFGTNYQIEGTRLVFDNADNFIAVNSYSSLLMFAAVIGGLLWVTVKAHVFHETHITPSFSAHLFNMNLEDLIHTTETVYSQAFIWLSYAWITTIVFGIHAYYHLSYSWLFFISLAVTVVSTAALAVDVEKEILIDEELAKPDDFSPETIVKFEEIAKELSQ